MPRQEIAYPQWTEYRKKNGLDPLGMQNGSINLYQRLLPGISNVTLRMRYYGFYAWLAATYARIDGSTDEKKWQRFVRRAEALYALAASHHGDISGIAGIRWAGRKLAESSSTIDFAVNADPDASGTRYLKQAWGAYGAAYGSQLFETGVLAQASTHLIPVPSPEFGDRLSQAVQNAWGQSSGLFLNAVENGQVTTHELDELKPTVPKEIAKHSPERAIYEELLFAEGPLKRADDIARRDTMRLLIEATSHLGERPEPSSVRWLFYAGADPAGRIFQPDEPHLYRHAQRWRIYQANDLLHFAYETLLGFALSVLEGYPGGLSLERLIAECLERISAVPDAWPTSWQDFEQTHRPADNPWDADAEFSEFTLTDNIGAHTTGEGVVQPAAAWAAFQLITIVLARSNRDRDLIATELGGLNSEGFHSLITEHAFVEGIRHLTFSSAAARILRERVINRHLWVAHRKFRYQGDYTFLLEADEGRVRCRAPSGPVFTSPRLGPAISFLDDLHLIDEHGLTVQGQRLRSAS